MSNNSLGLWNASFGEIGATLKALEDLGVTREHLAKIRSDSNYAKAVADVFLKAKEMIISSRYANEEVKSSFTYPVEYSIKSVEEQIEMLADLFKLDKFQALQYLKSLLPLDNRAEGYFAVLSTTALFPEEDDFDIRYCKILNSILEKLKKSFTFYNWQEGQIDAEHLRLTSRTRKAILRIEKEQPGPIIIIPAQFGLRHKGRSVRRALEVMDADEFGLGSIHGGSMILTHPNRFVRWEQLHLDLAGDKFSDGDGGFGRAPSFCLSDDGLRFDAHYVSYPGDGFGSASFFLRS